MSDGTIIINDTAKQQQNVDDLSRDVAHANQTLSPIFDKEKEQQRMQTLQLIGEIGNQAADIARTQGDIAGFTAAKAKHPTYTDAQLRETAEFKQASKPFGTGGDIQRAITASTAAIQGLAGGDIAKALAGASAPYLAEVIHRQTTSADGEVNKTANLMAHAVVNTALSLAKGENALAGASSAVTAEAVGMISEAYYDKKPTELKEDEKQTVSALASLAAGLAGGLVGGDTASAVSGMQTGKVTVENNWLSVDEAERKKALEQKRDILKQPLTPSEEKELAGIKQTDKDRDQAIKDICTQGNKGSVACGGLVNEAQSALVRYGDNVTYSLIYKDLYPQDEANIESILKGLDPDSITRDVVIKGIVDANGGKLSWSDVETRYDAMTISVEIVRALVGGKGKAPDRLGMAGKVPHMPNAGAVGNMGEFFKQSGFGSQMKETAQKTSKIYQGQTVYKSSGNINENIRKGDQFYLDGAHKNHLEVFDSKGNFRVVLNLDGSVNVNKTKAAEAERRRLAK